MPVNYVAPKPFLLNRAFGSRDSYGTGGGSGYGGTTVFARDSSADRTRQLEAIGLSGMIENDQIGLRAAMASQLARQNAELDAWLFTQRVTTQEAMQLRQDENAIAAILADPSMGPMEKQQAVTRIRTRIDWVSERQKRDLQEAQLKMYEAHAKQWEAQTKADEWRLKFQTDEINGKLKTIVDDDAAQEITAQLLDVRPDLYMNPVELARLVTIEAIAQGRATRYTVNEKGVIDMSKGVRVGQEGQLEGGTGKGSTARSGTMDETKGLQAQQELVFKINSMVNDWASKKVVPPSEEERKAYKKELMDELKQVESSYLSSNTEEGRRQREVQKQQSDLASIANARNFAANLPAGSPVHQWIAEYERLIRKYPLGSGKKRTQATKDRMDELSNKIAGIIQRAQEAPHQKQGARKDVGLPPGDTGDVIYPYKRDYIDPVRDAIRGSIEGVIPEDSAAAQGIHSFNRFRQSITDLFK